MVVVSARSLGKREPLFEDFTVALPPEVERGASGITLRALIGRVVRREVDAFHARQSQRAVLRVLTEREVAEAARRGKVAVGESAVPQVAVDPEVAAATACQAFEDGLYLAFLDGVEQKDLDREVWPKPDSQLLFVRLALLAGG
jgi:hypothetical protein